MVPFSIIFVGEFCVTIYIYASISLNPYPMIYLLLGMREISRVIMMPVT
jgi:hypothetical protein